MATFTATAGPDGWAAEILQVAEVLDTEEITTAAALRAADDARRKEVEAAWRGVVGQRSGITWRYAGMLAGVPGVKPDRMIGRFVADSLELPRRSVRTEFAYDIVMAAAKELDMSETALDYAIWRFQRGQR